MRSLLELWWQVMVRVYTEMHVRLLLMLLLCSLLQLLEFLLLLLLLYNLGLVLLQLRELQGFEVMVLVQAQKLQSSAKTPVQRNCLRCHCWSL